MVKFSKSASLAVLKTLWTLVFNHGGKVQMASLTQVIRYLSGRIDCGYRPMGT